jgi:hypothetical protein
MEKRQVSLESTNALRTLSMVLVDVGADKITGGKLTKGENQAESRRYMASLRSMREG